MANKSIVVNRWYGPHYIIGLLEDGDFLVMFHKQEQVKLKPGEFRKFLASLCQAASFAANVESEK